MCRNTRSDRGAISDCVDSGERWRLGVGYRFEVSSHSLFLPTPCRNTKTVADMAFLEVITADGETAIRELHRRHPLAIGSHYSNDVVIAEPDVAVMQGRVTYTKQGYELAAAGFEPIDVNGSVTMKQLLENGDLIRIGTVIIRFVDRSPVRHRETAEPEVRRPTMLPKIGKGKFVKNELGSDRPGLDALPKDEGRESDDRGDEQRRSARDSDRRDIPRQRSTRPEPEPQPLPDVSAELPLPEEPVRRDPAKEKKNKEKKTAAAPGVLAPRRPGEEDALRSPLVLFLTVGAVLLLLAAATFYFIGHRRTTAEEFTNAKQQFLDRRYQQAEAQFQAFLTSHPEAPQADEARVLRGLCQIDVRIHAGLAKYPEALEQLKGFIQVERDRPGFSDWHAEISRRAEEIALGAAAESGRAHEPALLKTTAEARQLLMSYSGRSTTPPAAIKQIDLTVRKSKESINKFEASTASTASIDGALAEQKPLAAFAARRELLLRYPDLEKPLEGKRKLAVEMERSLVKTDTTERPPATPAPTVPAATLAFHARPKSDDVSVNQAVPILANGVCVGIDSVTGFPVWRRPLGTETPFFPEYEPGGAAFVIYDSRVRQWLKVQTQTGRVLWAQSFAEAGAARSDGLEAEPYGRPSFVSDALFVTTRSGHLFRLDPNTGKVTAGLKFSQPVAAPVAVELTGSAESDRSTRLVCVGQTEVAYVLTERPLACGQVVYLGQAADSVRVPLQPMGPFTLLAENLSPQSSRVRMLRLTAEALTEVGRGEMQGQILDPPVQRGQDLFVGTTGERITAFRVSDDPAQPVLTRGPQFEAQGRDRSSVFLSAGPDRQVWCAAGSLRRLQLTGETLVSEPKPAAAGITSQPLQMQGERLFHARRRVYSDAVLVNHTDRETLTSNWQTTLGGEILAWETGEADKTEPAAASETPAGTPAPAKTPAASDGKTNPLIVANSAGSIYRVFPRQWQTGAWVTESSTNVTLPNDLSKPLMAGPLGNGTLGVAIASGDNKGGAEAKLVVIGRNGQVEQTAPLPSSPHVPPVAMGSRVLVGCAGRIVVAKTGTAGLVQPFMLPSDQAAKVRWQQLLAVSPQAAAALTSDGRLIVLKIVTQPAPQLVQAAVKPVDAIATPVVSGAGKIALAAEHRVQVVNGETLESLAEDELADSVRGLFILSGELLLIETIKAPPADAVNGQPTSQLRCVSLAAKLPERWSIPLSSSVIGTPRLQGNRLLVLTRNGIALTLNPETGEELARFDTGSLLQAGPITVGDQTLAISPDGALIKLP